MNKDNNKYRLLIENMVEGYAFHKIVRDISGTPIDYLIIDVNPAFEDIAGLPKEDILGKSVTEVLSNIEISGNDWISAYGQIADTGNSIRFESYLEYLNHWYEVSVYSEEQGYFATIFRNITKDKKAEQIYIASEIRYRRLFESAKDGILILEAETGKIMNVNPFLLNLLGYSEEDILGKSIWEIGTFKDVIASFENFLELQEKEYIRYENLPLQTVDGRVVAVEFVSNVYLEGDQKVIQCNIRDITERRKMEESLEKRLDELETIYAISKILRTAKTLDETLTLLLEETLKVLDIETGAICLYNSEKEQLEVSVSQGWTDSFINDVFLKAEEGIADQVFSSEKAIVSKEYTKDPRVKYSGKMPEGWGGVCLPLCTDENAVGVLFVSTKLPREIISGELKLLTSLADLAGTAIHRIDLFEKNLRHLEKVKALHNIDVAISDSLDLRVIFKVILEEVTRMFKVDAAAILRLESHTGVLKYEAWRGFRVANPAKVDLNIGEGLAGIAAMERKTIQAAKLREIEWDSIQFPFLKKEDAISYYAVPLINKGRVEGVLEIFHRKPLDVSKEWLEFLETLGGQTAIAIDRAEMVHQMQNTNYKLIQAYDNTIAGWARALDLRDKETGHHSQRVTDLTFNIARAMDVGEEDLIHVQRGAMLHDIGKMGVSDTILLKPGPLTDEEWAIMRRHPVYAFELLSPIAYLHPALDIPYCHHEKWDGSGYPRGLKEEEIPLAARIFAVVDVYDALTSDRPYRKAWSNEKTLEHIFFGRGKHFDPRVVELFLKEMEQLKDKEQIF